MVIVTHISAPEPESSTPRVLASQVWMATEFTEIYVKVHQKQYYFMIYWNWNGYNDYVTDFVSH